MSCYDEWLYTLVCEAAQVVDKVEEKKDTRWREVLCLRARGGADVNSVIDQTAPGITPQIDFSFFKCCLALLKSKSRRLTIDRSMPGISEDELRCLVDYLDLQVEGVI